MGKILAICTSLRRGTLKTPVPSAVLTPEWGIVGDAHGGSWHRQVSLLSAEKIEAFRQKLWVDYGAFGENLVVEGFDFATLPVPSFFAIGDAVLEMTQIGKISVMGIVPPWAGFEKRQSGTFKNYFHFFNVPLINRTHRSVPAANTGIRRLDRYETTYR